MGNGMVDTKPGQNESEVIKVIKNGVKDLAKAINPRLYETDGGDGDLQKFLDQIRTSTDAITSTDFEQFLAAPPDLPDDGTVDPADLKELRTNLAKLKETLGGPLETYDVRKENARFFLLTKAALQPGSTDKNLPALQKEAETAYRTYIKKVVDASTVPYFRLLGDKLGALPPMVLYSRLTKPLMIDIIYSYWLEMGMIYQTINAICRRFQNVDVPPLRFLNVSAIRGSAALTLLGFIEDESHRLRPARRSAFYAEQLGVSLKGNAVAPIAYAETRTRAMGSFNEVLRLAIRYYEEQTDRQKDPDAFPLVNPAKDLQLTLAEGANNQFGSLTFMARVELLVIQSLLAMPEIKSFLATRDMVSYPEPWIESVEAVNRLMGWNTASAVQYYELATRGERLMLALRNLPVQRPQDFGLTETKVMEVFLGKFKSEIQSYVQALRAVTGQDLVAAPVTLSPSNGRGALPARAR